ncbi:phage baseplate assembly protein V [Corallococcus llansteffanensis]|uniref:Phage tail protein n=1 Tax=Corallococcus llansteffanensis TaxID=2316731 RepID=A0A3A8N939_9BACT|nr:phage baseplate assembly protein V [Corallococcus llansteffanensis]RKH40796.1 phage tail protein [Corallococcus llansteffanensis]
MNGSSDDGPGNERAMPGVMVGLVDQTTGDPEQLGRIRVRYPWLNNTVLSNWCRVASFFAGGGVGAYFLPAKGDEVLIAFEAGNINVPYVIGALWNGKDQPPVTGQEKQQDIRMIKTRGGSTIRIDDTKGAEQIEIVDISGDRILFDAKKKSVSVTVTGSIELSAGAGSIKLSAAQIEIDATSSLKLNGPKEVSIDSGGPVSVKGSTIRLN